MKANSDLNYVGVDIQSPGVLPLAVRTYMPECGLMHEAASISKGLRLAAIIKDVSWEKWRNITVSSL